MSEKNKDLGSLKNFIKKSLIESVVIRGKKYVADNWLDLMKEVYTKLFSDVGIRKIDVKKDQHTTFLRLILNNEDRIFAIVHQNPLKGEITINKKYKRQLNSKEAFMLPSTIRSVYDEYLKTK